MKRLFLLLVTLLSLQTIIAQSFELYALAGLTVSQIDGDRKGGYDKMGSIAGLGISRPFDEKWSAQMELEYIQKGKGSYNEDGSTYKIRLNYIQVPVMVSYKAVERLRIESGFSMAFLISYEFIENGEINNAHRPYTPYFYDINWLIGATYSITEKWKMSLRFAYSIISMGDMTEDDTYRPNIWQNPGGQYNRSLDLTMQYWF